MYSFQEVQLDLLYTFAVTCDSCVIKVGNGGLSYSPYQTHILGTTF